MQNQVEINFNLNLENSQLKAQLENNLKINEQQKNQKEILEYKLRQIKENNPFEKFVLDS